jgi:uncharacterized repeat protein (TIGR01451 family)
MKKSIVIVLFVLAFSQAHFLNAQNFWIPDPAFRAFLKLKYPACFTLQDSLMTNCTDLTVDTNLSISNNFLLQSLDGLQYMTGLQNFNCSYCQNLNYLPAFPAQLKSIVLISNTGLSSIPALPSQLSSLQCVQISIDTLPPLPATLLSLTVTQTLLQQLPSLPIQLKYLYCYDNHLTSLPSMPDSLLVLYCQNNYSIAAISSFNTVLKQLNCNNYNIQISNLPSSLEELILSSSNLDSLPVLPPNLKRLECANNRLSYLPSLPNGIKVLNISNNRLSTLPALPDSLEFLSASALGLNSLPILPARLQTLLCTENNLCSLPNLPHNLRSLWCNNNPLSCLPSLPDSLAYLAFTNTFISCIPNQPLNLSLFNCSPQNPSICSGSAVLCGSNYIYCTAFLDANANGSKDLNEQALNLPYHFQSASYQALQASSFINLAADTGFTTVSVTVPNYYLSSTPAVQTIYVGNTPDTLYFGVYPIPGIKDLSIDMIPLTAMRPGFTSGYWLNYKNEGTDTIYNAQVSLIKPPSFSNIAQNPLATFIQADTLRWDLGTLYPNQTGFINVIGSVNSSAVLGSYLVSEAIITPVNNDTLPYNNYASSRDIVIGSYDPNDKTVSTDSVLVNSTDYLEYTIRFQNTGTDTAFTIVVIDTLSPLLNATTILPLSASHYYILNVKNNNAYWYFPNILLPDSGINERASHGFIKFKILKTAAAASGLQIPNTAAIYFDYNNPVITNTAIVNILPLTLPEISKNQLQLFPNPVYSFVQIKSSTNASLGVVKLMDIEGKLLEERFIESDRVDWNVKYLPVGSYIFVGKNWTQKIIKQ